jgi:hypothetical protein
MKDHYAFVVSELLQRGKYCLLKDHVILTVFYRILRSDSSGEFVDKEPQEDAYEKHVEPFKYTYLSRRDDCVYVHVLPDIDTVSPSAPVKCIHITLRRGLINGYFNKSFVLFEEEIYTFLTYLNFSPTKIHGMLNLTFADATRFVPVDVQMRVRDYDVGPLTHTTCSSSSSSVGTKYFGSKVDGDFLFQPREIEGRMSKARSNSKILSLRDGRGWMKDEGCIKPEWIDSIVSPYVVYWSVERNSYLPLAFNPFENPIISSK